MSQMRYGDKVTVPAAATNLTSLLGLTTPTGATSWPGRSYRTLTIRADTANAATVWFGKDTTLTTGAHQMGYIRAAEAYTEDLHGGSSYTSNFFIIGNGTDVVYVTLYEG